MSEQNLNDILSGGGLSSLLQNPEIAAKLPKIMEALGPVMAEMRAEQSAEPTVTAGESGNASETATLPKPKVHDGAAARRRALLRALEPYLSDNRREAMDYVGKVLSLIDILSEVI